MKKGETETMTTESNAKIRQRLDAVATRANAAEYDATDEKFIYCIDLLDISAHRYDADDLVNELEDRFGHIMGRTV